MRSKITEQTPDANDIDNLDTYCKQVKDSVKEDILQIERELIEGWLGSVSNFDDWEKKVNDVQTVGELCEALLEAQSNMQSKYLKGIMTPVKITTEGATECEEKESPGLKRWKEAVENCQTYSRLHVLVGIFDSCIKWERSHAIMKCRLCRKKQSNEPLAVCEKCSSSYHWYCHRPPLKDDPPTNWLCSRCCPEKVINSSRIAAKNEVRFYSQL